MDPEVVRRLRVLVRFLSLEVGQRDSDDLDALLADWERQGEALAQEIEAESLAVPLGKAFDGGPLHGTSIYNVMLWAVRRIRGGK